MRGIATDTGVLLELGGKAAGEWKPSVQAIPDTDNAHYQYGLYLGTNPSSVYFEKNGVKRTFIAYQDESPDGSYGVGGEVGCDPWLVYYDHTAETFSTPRKVSDTPIKANFHSGCCLAIDANDKLHIFYGAHSTAGSLRWRRSTRALDVNDPFTGEDDWEAEIDTEFQVTYPQVVIDTDGTLWIFARRYVSDGSPVSYYQSTNYAGTWGDASLSSIADITVLGDFARNPLITPTLDNDGNMHFGWHKGASPYDVVCYMKWHKVNDRFEKADGTALTLPVDEDDVDLIASGERNYARSECLAVNSSGHIFLVYDDGGDSKFIKWNGSSWSTAITIDTSMRHSLLRLLSDNVIDIYIAKDKAVLRYRSVDGGDTFTFHSTLLSYRDIVGFMSMPIGSSYPMLALNTRVEYRPISNASRGKLWLWEDKL